MKTHIACACFHPVEQGGGAGHYGSQQDRMGTAPRLRENPSRRVELNRYRTRPESGLALCPEGLGVQASHSPPISAPVAQPHRASAF